MADHEVVAECMSDPNDAIRLERDRSPGARTGDDLQTLGSAPDAHRRGLADAPPQHRVAPAGAGHGGVAAGVRCPLDQDWMTGGITAKAP